MRKKKPERVPRHVAIIMDGNGRWARQRGWPRLKGHEAGAEAVRKTVTACKKAGVEYLTLYAFSVENWVRPKPEIQGLMRLLLRFLKQNEKDLHEQNIRLRIQGELDRFPRNVRNEIERVTEATRRNKAGQLVLALNYGGRRELARAARAIARQAAAGTLRPDSVDERTVAAHLYLPDVPDPDLLIRTSGEMRVSNFLLWQISYAELYVTPVFWPDFDEKEFGKALGEYAKRERRFGAVKPGGKGAP